MANFHSPKSYATMAAVIESGHWFNTTPHGIRGHAFRAPVCGNDGAQADILFYGWRDDFSNDVVQRIRATQERRHTLYMSEPGRPVHELTDIAYAVAYRGQCIAYVTVARDVVMNEPMATAAESVRRAYRTIQHSLTALAARPDHYLFSTAAD